MPRPCSLCQHPEREAIEQALAAKEPYRAIAKRFGTSPATLYRHQQDHAQPHVNPMQMGAQSIEVAPDPRAAALLDAAQRLHTIADSLYRRTLDVRSTHDARVLQHAEEQARLHLEVTRLLTEVLSLLAAPSGR